MNDTSAELRWDPPAPGPWQQDQAHNPVATTVIVQELVPAGFDRGFRETFAAFGVLLDTLAMASVNGFWYHQPQPFDMPGPDGPKDPDWIGQEFGRRVGVAAAAMEGRIWRDAMKNWDENLKPTSQARHRELGAVDLASLDDAQLRQHIEAVTAQVREMAYQHHRYNAHTLAPVGDFLLHAAGWAHRPPTGLFGVFDGYSPVSNVSPPEMQDALAALRADQGSIDLLHGEGAPADVLAELEARHPEVADYVANVHFRLLEGFDVTNPTIGERPEAITGRLRAALDVDHDTARDRADAAAAELRAATPAEHQAEFDDLLGEARHVYRLRDERGLFSDISAIGLLRLALLEFGRRLEGRGRVKIAEDVLDASVSEIEGLFDGADTPAAEELHQRSMDRLERTLAGAPRHLGDPPPPPPPVDMLPPPLARVMSAVGFTIEGVLGELEEPVGDDTTIGGVPGAPGVYEGRARLIRSVDDLFDLEQGDVLLAPATGEAFNSMLHLVGAMVTDHGSYASHAAIVSREMGIPAVVGTVDGSKRIPDGARVRVDGTAGSVTIL